MIFSNKLVTFQKFHRIKIDRFFFSSLFRKIDGFSGTVILFRNFKRIVTGSLKGRTMYSKKCEKG